MAGNFLRSGAGVKGKLPFWARKLLQDSLSTQGCFSIGDVDVTDEGYTIRYASPGFCDLFDCESSDCLGKRCCNFVGYNLAARHLIFVAKTLGMDLQEAKTRAQFALEYFAQQGTMFSGGTWDKPSSGVAYALVLASNGTSEPFVCELVLSSRSEPRTSWGYSVILHRDVTNEVPVRKLLEAACPGGGFDQLVQEQKLGLRRRLSSAGIESKSAVLCFQQMALEVWTGKLIDKAREIAAKVGPFPAWEYRFVQDNLSTQQSFLLADCGLTDDGVTLRYTSPGFCDLFELKSSEIAVTRYCQQVIGYHVIRKNIVTLTAQVRMDLEQVRDRLRFVYDFVLGEAKATVGSWDRPSRHLGFALGLCYKATSGIFFVCELSMLVRTEPHTGWPYFAAFHRSVAHEVPVRRLLEAACPGGGLEQLVQESRKPSFLESIGIYSNSDSGTSKALHFLDEKVFDTWTGMVKDALWTPGLDLHPAQGRSRSRSRSMSPELIPDWAYALIQGGLSDKQSFTICDHDLTDEGLTILYASPGFCDLFESNASEFLGTRCCYQCDASQLAIAADTLGMGIQEIDERLQFMHRHFVKQAAEQVGFSLLLACKGSGTLFVCAATLMSHTEQTTGWQYISLLQMDVTDEVGIRKLLEAACPTGGFDQLLHESRLRMLQCLESLGVRLSDSPPPFQQEALERWTGQLMDVVRRDQHRAAAKAPRAPPPSCASDSSQSTAVALRPAGPRFGHVVQRSAKDKKLCFS
ncbi:unnamed protein product [Polarella glacialis]|uniref:PAS domain-containing protein n=1 Tax=Polarella glacialis TaxID=89957 RepID=A0A813LAM6_POLGL|nr:unnamed protein product [Polarella glacialis]CAE8722959.1 unnamed protein product [Polarella glacialis]